MPRLVRRARPALAVLAAALVLTGCSNGDADKPAAASETNRTDATATASGTATQPTGSSAPASPEASAAAFLKKMKAGLSGRGTAHIELRTTGLAATRASGDLRYGPDGNELTMTSVTPKLTSRPMRVVIAGKSTYLSVPGLTPRGRYFRLGNDDPRLRQLIGSATELDPRTSFDSFRAGLLSATEVGEEPVGGAATTRYRLLVDTGKVLEAQGGTSPQGMPETVEYDVWLDGRGRMRRLTTEIGQTRLRMSLSDWGKPVTIRPPDPNDIVRNPKGF